MKKMINTKKNIIVSAAIETFIFVLIALQACALSNASIFVLLVMIALLILGLIMLGMRDAKLEIKRAKIRDYWKSDSYPIDMSHNDEREWSLQLRANYIANRITAILLVVLLVLLLVINKLPSQKIVLPVSANVLGILLITATILVNEWAYAFAYCYLDR